MFHKGHELYSDNWYINVDLTNKEKYAFDWYIHFEKISNTFWNPNKVITTKLKCGKIIIKENNNGITVLKWKDERDILFLSTKILAKW